MPARVPAGRAEGSKAWLALQRKLGRVGRPRQVTTNVGKKTGGRSARISSYGKEIGRDRGRWRIHVASP